MEWRLRQSIVEIGQEVHRSGLVAATDGNISARLTAGRFLITPTGVALGRLRPQDLVVIDGTGRRLTGDCPPSSEYRLHLAIYEMRRDVSAVVHAHPPIANAFTFAGVSIEACVIPEVVASLGNIPTSDYATPSTAEGAEVVRGLIRNHDAIMLQRHGSVTVGRTLLEAYQKLEKVEHSARVLLAARTLGRVVPLSEVEIRKIAALRGQLGYGPADDVLRACGLLPNARC